MLRLALLLVLVAGCPGGGDDDYPIGPGGGGGGSTNPGAIVDAPSTIDAIDAPPNTIVGRVCVLTNMRRLINAMPTDCASAGAGGYLVTLGSGMATTGIDGSFAIPDQLGSGLVWRVTDPAVTPVLVPSFVPFSQSKLLPVMTVDQYNEELGNAGIVVQAGEGAIVARVVKGSVAQAGAVAAVSLGEAQATYYDTTVPATWSTSATGALGVAWLPDNLAGNRTLIVTPQGGQPQQANVNIVDGAITFVTISVP